ncbi:MAG: TonB family protein [Desulfuromusa sp.]|nr:TonB family protein [Desulfuromusa sp.]
MDSVARIAFFIILSFVLHILSLPFDFMLSAESFSSGQVGVKYVSRPLDSFYPGLESKKTLSRVAKSPAKSVQKASRDAAVQPKRIESTITETELKQKVTPSETVPIAISKSLSGSSIGELALNQHEAVVESMDSPPEVFKPPVMQAAVKTEAPVEEVLSSLGDMIAQTGTSDVDLDQASPSSGQQNSNLNQEFKNALPRYDVNPPPRYPEVAKLRGWEGKVVLEAMILKSGRVGSLNVVASSGYKSLDRAARKAINRWKFRPATSFGISIDSQVEIPVTFSLKDL